MCISVAHRNKETLSRIKRDKMYGWKCPPFTLYAGRPSKWGNPFIVGKHYTDLQMLIDIGFLKNFFDGFGYLGTKGYLVKDLKDCLTLYRLWLEYMIKKFPEIYNLAELGKYKYIACYCDLDKPCHVDVLIEFYKLNVIY